MWGRVFIILRWTKLQSALHTPCLFAAQQFLMSWHTQKVVIGVWCPVAGRMGLLERHQAFQPKPGQAYPRAEGLLSRCPLHVLGSSVLFTIYVCLPVLSASRPRRFQLWGEPHQWDRTLLREIQPPPAWPPCANTPGCPQGLLVRSVPTCK